MNKITKSLLWLFILLLIGGGAYYFFFATKDAAKVSYHTAKASIADLSTSITATGTIEPVKSVEVGTQVSGIISKIYVDYNTVVRRGQIIAELDRTNLVSELSSAQSQLMGANSDLSYQKANFERLKNLYDKGHISTNEYETARLALQQAQAQVLTRQEAVRKAKTNLAYATITSPIDGVVISRAVEEGQTVAASFSTPTLFTIAKDLTDMRIIANVDEADIGNITTGQRVSFTVDAFPDDSFEGRVTQVRQQAKTTSNVVTYEVVISAANPELKLKPGLTANVVVYTSEKTGVLTVPASALRFTPNEMLLAEGESIRNTAKSGSKVWVREGKVFRAIDVVVGTSNGTNTQILSGLREGQEVLTEMVVATAAEAENGSNSNPFMPGPKKNNTPKK